MGLCAQKPYEAITVKELCERAPVARTTFYAHYRNIAEVRQEIEDGLIDGLMDVITSASEGDLAGVDFADVLDAIFGFVRENQEWISVFLVTQPSNRFIGKWKDAIKGNLAVRYPEASSRSSWNLISEMAATAAIGAYTYWLTSPDEVDAVDADHLVDRVLSAVMANA